jgi:hypothetical protein
LESIKDNKNFIVPAGETQEIDRIERSYVFIEHGAHLSVERAIDSEFQLAKGAKKPKLHFIKNCLIVDSEGHEEKIELEPKPVSETDYENARPRDPEQLNIATRWKGFLAQLFAEYPLEAAENKKKVETKLKELELFQKFADYYAEHLTDEDKEELKELSTKTMAITPKWKEILARLAGETADTISDKEIDQTLERLNEIQTVSDQYTQTENSPSDLSEEEQTKLKGLIDKRRDAFENGEWRDSQEINEQIIALCQSPVTNSTINLEKKVEEELTPKLPTSEPIIPTLVAGLLPTEETKKNIESTNMPTEETISKEEYEKEIINESRTIPSGTTIKIGYVDNSVINIENGARAIVQKTKNSKFNLYDTGNVEFAENSDLGGNSVNHFQ